MTAEFNVFIMKPSFSTGKSFFFVSNIYVLKGLKCSEAQIKKVVFKISITTFQIPLIFFFPETISHRVSIHYVL